MPENLSLIKDTVKGFLNIYHTKKMKKLLTLLVVVSAFLSTAHAQGDAKAKTILAEVSKKYRSYTMLSANFTMNLENAKAKVKEAQKGTLVAKANSNKYKVTMTNQELISDGKSQWIYLKNDGEVQINNVDNSEEALNPAKLFTIYEKGFKYAFSGESTVNGKPVYQITLTPVDGKKQLTKVILSIHKTAKNIVRAIIYDKGGSVYTYSVDSFNPNVKVTESVFTFDAKKYPGVEIVDLR